MTDGDTWVELLGGTLTRSTAGSAAFDLTFTGNHPVALGRTPVALPTGVRTRFSPNLVAVMKERSSLAREGVRLGGGVIDSDYADEWRVLLSYHPAVPSTLPYVVTPGMRVAQVVFLPLPALALVGDGWVLKGDPRVGGFGSTGG